MQLVTAGSATLDAPAAAAYARALAAGAPNSVTSSYRDPAAQLALYQAWVRRLPGYNFALHPSKSDHCKGLAIDLAGVKAKTWFRVHGREYGWLFTDGTEDWHIAYRPAHDRHTTDPAPATTPAASPPIDPEDTTMQLVVTNTGGYHLLSALRVWDIGSTAEVDKLAAAWGPARRINAGDLALHRAIAADNLRELSKAVGNDVWTRPITVNGRRTTVGAGLQTAAQAAAER